MGTNGVGISDLIINTSLNSVEFIALQRKYKKELKTTTLSPGDKAEREIWLTFSYLKPNFISKKNISIPLSTGGSREIDVLVIFNEAVLIIESKEGKTHNPSAHIDKIFGYKTEFQNYLKKTLNITHKNFVFILYYSELSLDNDKFLIAQKKNIFLYSPKHKDFYLKIISKMHEDAKDVIFSDLLSGHDWVDTRNENFIHVPCVKGKMGKEVFYQFLLSPEILKKISFVHRRYLQYMINDDEFSYQRIIQPDRLIDIKKFVKEGNYFPNSILVNFNREIKFERGTKPKYGLNDVEFGYLVLPKKYGYAWIIDGQHRVFGFCGLPEESRVHQLSVIATIQMESQAQAQLYVDINQNQKAIDKDDIWDLYTQLEEPAKLNYQISKLVKDLNKSNVLLKERVYIPSLKKQKNQFKINISNIAGAIKSNCKDIFDICTETILREENRQTISYKKINFEKLNFIFDEYFKKLSTDNRIQILLKKELFFGTNNGTDILLRILNKFKQYIIVNHQEPVKVVGTKSQLLNYLNRFTDSVIKGINNFTEAELQDFVKQSSSSSRKDNSLKILEKSAKYDSKIKEICNGIFLDGIKEDLATEFKSSAIYNIKGEKNEDVFKEEILGTIVAFINRGIEGKIYLGIDDYGKKIGVNRELTYFRNGFDEYKRQIIKSASDNIRIPTKCKVNIHELLEINELEYEPKIVELKVKRALVNTVAVLAFQAKKMVKVYYKADASTVPVSKSEYPKYFNEEQINLLNGLISDLLNPT